MSDDRSVNTEEYPESGSPDVDVGKGGVPGSGVTSLRSDMMNLSMLGPRHFGLAGVKEQYSFEPR